MTVYNNRRKNSAIRSMEYEPDGTAYVFFFRLDNVSHQEAVKQWLASDNSQIIAETAIDGHPLLIVRSDNTEQVAYRGLPLYRYSGDHAAGEAHGDGVGGAWHVVRLTDGT